MSMAEGIQRRIPRRIPADLWDAREEARRIVAEATAEARAIVEGARAEADVIRARAASDGREEGLARATGILARAARERDALLASAEPQLVELAFAVARRVLARAVEGEHAAVVEIAARALEAARHRSDVRLRAHPEDLAALRAAEPALLEGLVRARCVALLADPGVGRGGVVVETEAGSIDARLETQLDGLRRALAEPA